MRVAFVHARCGDFDEAGVVELLDGVRACIAHASAESADHLIDHFREASLVRNASDDAFRHEFLDVVFHILEVTVFLVGLTYEQLQYTSRELGNTANDHVKPTIYIETETLKHEGKAYLVAYVKSGDYKPYKDLSGNIWVKQGADKRRVTENAEIRRLFQKSHQYQADEEGVDGSSEADIDTKALDEYFNKVFGKRVDEFNVPVATILKNAHITDELGRLTIAGLMYFAKEPQMFRPQHCIKAVWFVGNHIGGTQYRDSRDITGTIPEMYEDAMRWLKSCLSRPQNGQSFNSEGDLEISEVVLQELSR